MLYLPPPKPMLALPLLTDVETVNVTEGKTVNVTDLIQQALMLHETIERIGRKTTKLAWRLGRVLIDIRAARKLEGKGKWEASFQDNHGRTYDDGTEVPSGDLCAMSIETARRYIRLAKRFPTDQDLPDVPLCEAYLRAGIYVRGRSEVEQAAAEVTCIAESLEVMAQKIRKLRRQCESAYERMNGRFVDTDERYDDYGVWSVAYSQFNTALRECHSAICGGFTMPTIDEDGNRVRGSGESCVGFPQW